MKKCIICGAETQEVYCYKCLILTFTEKLKKLKELADEHEWSADVISSKIEDVAKYENNLSWERIWIEGVL